MADIPAVEHLRQARQALLRQRQQIDAAVGQIDATLATLDAAPPVTTTVSPGVISAANALRPFTSGTFANQLAMLTGGGVFSAHGVRASAPAHGAAAEVSTPVVREVPTVRDAILQVLAEADHPLKTMDIIIAVEELGVRAHDDSVRSILAKLYKAGQVSRVAHGVYMLPAPESAEAPAVTGASVVSATTGEEVTDDGTTHMDPEDQAGKADDPDGRSGAPVGGQGLVAL